MKKNIQPYLFIFCLLVLSFFKLDAQEPVTPTIGGDIKANIIWQDESIYRRQMKANGLSDAVIDQLVEEKIRLFKSGRNIKWSAPKTLGNSNNPPIPFAACSDMGGEGGWGGWQAEEGKYSTGSTSTLTLTPAGVPTLPRFNLTSGPGVDTCTPFGGGPPLPVVAPGFGSASIQLGESQRNGIQGGCDGGILAPAGCAEQLVYSLNITAQDTNFLYAFAYVIENPPGHTTDDQPYVEFKILDSGGGTLPCSYQRYFGNSTTPGLYNANSNCRSDPSEPAIGTVIYKPWTTVGVNLSKYVGQVVTVIITNVDCARGGHFAHSYWDFSCGVFETTPGSYCVGQQVTITAPSDPLINYDYQWYKNGTAIPPPIGDKQIITPYPVPGDTFLVDVMQLSGCNFKLVYVPTPLSVGANFTYTTTCGSGTVDFADSAVVVPDVTVTNWSWTFQNGTPSTYNGQNPTPISFPPGTHSATLITTSQAGCRDTVIKSLTIGTSAQAAFSSIPVCEGLATQFTNSSIPVPGDPIISHTWSFPFGSPASSTAANPAPVTYPAGTYTATLTLITQQGCTSTVSQPVVVNPLPVANLSGTNVCFNQKATVFQDLSTANNSIADWKWDFGDGNADVVQNPSHTYSAPGTYSVTLSVENNFGCKDTNTTTVVVHPLPVPDFISLPVCLGDTTCFTDQSSVTPGSIVGWNWNFGDPASGMNNNLSNLQNPCHIYKGAGPYTVLLTVTSDSGCQLSKSLPVSTVPAPNALFTVPNACFDITKSTSFLDLSTPSGSLDPIVNWFWMFGDGTTSNAQNPVHTYTSSGTYTSTLVITTTAGCMDTITGRVTLYNPPIANYSDSTDGCAPVCTSFQDLSTSIDGTISNWNWSFPGGNPSISTSASPTVCWNTPGTYDVQLIVTSSYGCKDTLATPQYIKVYAWPNADFCVAPDVAPATNPEFLFCDLWTKDVIKWTWDFGDGVLDSTSTDPKHSYSATANGNDFYHYNICLNVQTIHGCWDTICKPIDILPEFEFYIPNSFTPNGDNKNKFFFGKSRGVKDYEIWIFDRWGNLVWDCSIQGKNTDWDRPGQDGMSAACKWDGIVEKGAGADLNSHSGNLVQEDVYVWKVKLTDIFDIKHTYVGHVSSIR